MKFYCILLDAFPWSPQLRAFGQRHGMTELSNLSYCFTTPTLHAMLTGRLPSDLMPGGVGYQCYKNPGHYAWRDHSDISLIDLLGTNGISFVNRNRIEFFAREIMALQHFHDIPQMQEVLHEQADRYIHAAAHTPRYKHIRLEASNPASDDHFTAQFGDHQLCEGYYANERAAIKRDQASQDDLFVLQQSVHFSASVYSNPSIDQDKAYKRTLEELEHWDFDEPDAVFWVFADHGHQVTRYSRPRDYLTWVLYKDNTSTPIKPGRSLVFCQDFYQLVLEKFGITQDAAPGYQSQPLAEAAVPDQVYWIEDVRWDDHPTLSQTATGIQIECDANGDQIQLWQASYFAPEGTYWGYRQPLGTEGHPTPESFDCHQATAQPHLASILHDMQQRFSWLRKRSNRGDQPTKIYYGNHPAWHGVIHLYADGRLSRPGVDKGSYELEEGKRLFLKWDRWPPEELLWDEEQGLYRDSSKPYTLVPVPLMTATQDGAGPHSAPRVDEQVAEQQLDQPTGISCAEDARSLNCQASLTRVYIDAVCDLFHWGHAELFRKARAMVPNPYLIVWPQYNRGYQL